MSAYGALEAAANGIAAGVKRAASTNARAAARANQISKQAQTDQGQFNQGSVNIANDLGTQRLADQYAFNSAQAAAANDFTRMMWDQTAAWNEKMWQKSADWNEMMWGKQAEFNAAEAQKNREWQEMMRKTAYQTAVKDMQKSGLNPILAVTGGGIATGATGGGAASVGMASSSAPSMGSAQGAMASGSALQGLSASESSYSGQMENTSNMLALLSAGIEGLSTALAVMSQSKDIRVILEGLSDNLLNPNNYNTNGRPDRYDPNNMGKSGTYENNYKKHWESYWRRNGSINSNPKN